MSDQLYDLIGGKKTVWAATDAFYKRVLRDETLRPFFKDADLPRLRERQSMFVAMLLGGQTIYTGKDLSAAHVGARAEGLTHVHFDNFLKHFRGALLEVGVQPEKVETVMAILETRRSAVLSP
jgi:hemoglobin